MLHGIQSIDWLRLIWVACMFAAAQARAVAQAAEPPPPNIVWLTVEDMSPWIGPYGDATVPTPHLDRLAREGVVYANAFATSPVCAPARSALITGMFCTRIGTMHMRNGQPFFAVFNFIGTHESQAFPHVARQPAVVAPEDVPLPPFYPDTPHVRDAVARTYDNIAAMDRWVGDRLQELRDAGRRAERVVSFVDFGPTVLSLAGIEPDARLDGTPFLGRYARERDDYRRGHAYANADRFDAVYDQARSVSDGRYRYTRNVLPDIPYLVRNAYREQLPMTAELYTLEETGPARPEQWQLAARQRPPEEFYDSAEDPWEVRNLIDAPEQQPRIAALRAHLDVWLTGTGDLGFVLPETTLVKNHIWPPEGRQPATPPAEIDDKAVLRGDAMAFVVSLSCPDPGASIGYRLGTEKRYSGPWQVYTTPFEVPADRRFIEVRTHRIGHTPTMTGALLGRE